MKKLLAAVALVAFSSTAAHAGFLIEPYVGYASNESDATPPVESTGMFFGARLGGSTLGFIYGLDVQKGSMTTDETPEEEFDTTDMGLFVGYEFPILIRAYATYFASAESEFADGSSISGNGTRFGIGYTGLPFVAINFEITKYTYDEGETAAGVSGPLTTEVGIDGMGLSLSIPLP